MQTFANKFILDYFQTTHQKTSHVNLDEAIFQPFPSDIIFQNFVPFQRYELPLVLRNNDSVPRLIKVTNQESPYFQITRPGDGGNKVAPGMSITYKICFMPNAIKDYDHELICTSEREKFLIPIKCIGARGLVGRHSNMKRFAQNPLGEKIYPRGRKRR